MRILAMKRRYNNMKISLIFWLLISLMFIQIDSDPWGRSFGWNRWKTSNLARHLNRKRFGGKGFISFAAGFG
ncbi:hypothetical protein GWI33_022060 [Rhynchophorus ferrugineus]|uniref:Uncharacterized protein n=1 Tax=Rhynchophorus ferrugineus TaxID=354439 RepID=A0A834IR63_RHYFE|nr:hypothetical protein GWI33_022060 [Rhynchophorus ferrugineus]